MPARAGCLDCSCRRMLDLSLISSIPATTARKARMPQACSCKQAFTCAVLHMHLQRSALRYIRHMKCCASTVAGQRLAQLARMPQASQRRRQTHHPPPTTPPLMPLPESNIPSYPHTHTRAPAAPAAPAVQAACRPTAMPPPPRAGMLKNRPTAEKCTPWGELLSISEHRK